MMKLMSQMRNNVFFSYMMIVFLLTTVAQAAVPALARTIQLADQQEAPVATAMVHLLVGLAAGADQANPAKQSLKTEKLTIETNAEGILHIPDLAGSVQVVSIKKDGYRITDKQIKQINQALTQTAVIPAEGNPEPMIIKLHKSSGPAFLRISQDTFKVHMPYVGSYLTIN